MNYADAPAAVRRRSPSDDLATGATTGTTSTGTGALDVPDAGTPGRNTQQYHRAPLGVALTTPPQLVGIGAETKQSGSGRAHIPAALALPVQSATPEPDRRRIARPMPTADRDETVIGGADG